MQVPGNMTTPRLRLGEGEAVLAQAEGMRKKGLFGNRFGALVVTNERVAFVKAIMKSGLVSAAANAAGARPMLSFSHDDLRSAVREPWKKQVALIVAGERFIIEDAGIDQLLAALPGA